VTQTEYDLLDALRAGDEVAFARLVDDWGPAMLRLARLHVPSRAVAEEVVQETWLAVLRGLPAFEGRSSLKTWTFSILLNVARSKGRRERRILPFAALRDRHTVAPERFQGRRDERPGWWAVPPARWDPHEALESKAAQAALQSAVAGLAPRQREAIVLRDVLGVDSEEACQIMGVSEGNHRVLLHRARARVRDALERHFEERAA